MAAGLSNAHQRKIEAGIRKKYRQVALSPDGEFSYPTGRAGLEALGYERKWTDCLPESVADAYCGVGNPFSLGTIQTGDIVLDIGCGAGVDTIIAALMTGRKGRAVGIDLVPEMIRRAEENRRQMEIDNLIFSQADVAAFDIGACSIDKVISNGVFNLIPDKGRALKTVFHALKPGGLLMLADQIAGGPVTKNLEDRIDSWFR